MAYSVASKEKLENMDLSAHDYITKALNGKQNWSKLFYSDIFKTNIMVLSTPIYGYKHGRSNNIIGTLNILIDQEKLNLLVRQCIEKLGDSADAYLINETGLLLTETRRERYSENSALKEIINTEAVKSLSKELAAGNVDFRYTGFYKDYLGNSAFGSLCVVRLGEFNAGLIIEIDVIESFAGAYRLYYGIILILSVFVVIAIILVWIITRSITKALQL